MYKLTKKTEKKQAELELQIEIPFSEIEKEWLKSLKELKDGITIDGFRPGMVPDSIVIEKLGEDAVLEKAGRNALNRIFPKILEAEKIEVISAPNIEISELKKGEAMKLTATVATMPKVTLPDYKKIAKEICKNRTCEPIKDEDVKGFIDNIRKQRATAIKRAEQESKGISKEDLMKIEAEESEWPAIDEAFIKTLGTFDSVDDFMIKVRKHLEEESLARHNQTIRADIIESIVDQTKIDMPEVLIEQELDKMEHQFKADIKNMGLEIDKYLEALKKDMGDLRKEWRENATKRATANIVMPEIARIEKLTPDMAQVEQEAEHIMQHVKDADPARTKLYVYSVLTNEKVFEFLEGKEGKSGAGKNGKGETGKNSEEHVHDENCGHDH